ncbi:MAG: AlpA family phage regulatory protein [Rugosibacter sp.]|nr:AlpA family phage regulatory protein [Rugosibacter sp.]MDD3381579.1 AlpA family phage regulatory protein [Rugosibacter sp.]
MCSSEQPKAAQPTPGIPPALGRVPSTPPQPDKLIRIKTVCELSGLGKTSVYSIPDFPKRVVLSRRAVGWRLSEVMHWIESRSTVGA